MALPSHPAFASLAAACALLVGVAFASVRGWIHPYGRTSAAGVVISTLLGTNAFVLYTDDAREARVKVAAEDAERLLIDGEYAWPLLLVVAGCILGCVVVSLFRACVEASARRMVPLVPGRSARAGRRATGCGWRTLVEPVLFLASVWALVYCLPGVVGWHNL